MGIALLFPAGSLPDCDFETLPNAWIPGCLERALMVVFFAATPSILLFFVAGGIAISLLENNFCGSEHGKDHFEIVKDH